MTTIPHAICGVIPQHLLTRVASQTTIEASEHARATLEHMRELATGRAQTLMAPVEEPRPRGGRRRVYDAGHQHELPGRLVISADRLETTDVEALEAWYGSGATLAFFRNVFGRRSIDGNGMRIDSTVHYGTGFENAMWNGRQMVYGDGDGRIFHRFTASLDVIAHELTHGVIQHAAALGYSGQTGALNEHISDAFGIMVRQYALGQSATESDWLVGARLFGPAAEGCALRSFALPGSAYDHPLLGRDPQPSHMRDYVETDLDNGGVHINSGILNHGFYRAAIAIGGNTWEVLGRIWYAVLTERLTADADFAEFTRATIDVAGELYGIGSKVQYCIADAWEDVGLPPLGPLTDQPPMTEEGEPLMSQTTRIPYEVKKEVDACVHALAAIEQEQTAMADTPNGVFQRALSVYERIKPLFVALTVLPLIPTHWRKGVAAGITALDSLLAIAPNVVLVFKAGRDLVKDGAGDTAAFKAGRDLDEEQAA